MSMLFAFAAVDETATGTASDAGLEAVYGGKAGFAAAGYRLPAAPGGQQAAGLTVKLMLQSSSSRAWG